MSEHESRKGSRSRLSPFWVLGPSSWTLMIAVAANPRKWYSDRPPPHTHTHLFHNYQESPETLTKRAFAVAKSVLFCFFLWLSNAFCAWCHPIKKWCCKEGICVRTAQPEMEVIIFGTNADSIRDTAHIWGLSQTVMSLPTRGNCTSWMGSKRPLMLLVSAKSRKHNSNLLA